MADVIVVFAGSDDRVEAGFNLAKAGYAPYLIISPANMKEIETYKNKFANSSKISWLIEDKAQSTFENALFTKNIILNMSKLLY